MYININKTKIISFALVFIAWLGMFYSVFFRQIDSKMGDYAPLYIASKITYYQSSIRHHMYDYNPKHYEEVAIGFFSNIAVKEKILPKKFNPKSIHPYVYPPFFAWQMRPLSYFSYDVSKKIFTAITALFFLGGFYLAYREIFGKNYFVLIFSPIAMLLFYPLYACVDLGQFTTIIFGLFSLSLYFANRKMYIIAGIILGYCISVKITPVIIVLLFLLFGRFKLAFSAIITAAVLVFLLPLFTGYDLLWAYLKRIAGISERGTLPVWVNLSFQAMILRCILPLESILSCVQHKLSGIYLVMEKIFLFTVYCVSISSTYFFKRKVLSVNSFFSEKKLNNFIFCNGIFLSVLSFQIYWHHYGVYFILPFLWIVHEISGIKDNKKAVLVLSFLLMISFVLIAVDIKLICFWLFDGRLMKEVFGLEMLIVSIGTFGSIILFGLVNSLPVVNNRNNKATFEVMKK